MNILKNVFNWTVGSFFRTIGRIIAFIVIGFIIFQLLSKANIDITNIFMPKLSAATLTSKAIYTEGYYYAGDYNNWGSNNTYNYGLAPFSVQGKAYYNVGNINTTYTGKAYQLAFGFQYNLMAQKYYDITFNFKSRDLTSNLTTNGVHLASGSSSSTIYDTDYLSLIGVTNTATTGNNTNKLVIRIYAVQPITYWVIELQADPNNLTSVNNFGIASITIDEVDTTNSQEIINNQTNNTQNIINNQNNTTQQIIDSQNELLGRKCENMFNNSNITPNTTVDSSGNSFSANGFFLVNDFISVEPSTQYSLDSYNGYRVVEYTSSQVFIQRLFDVKSFTTSANTYYIKLSGNTSNLNNVMLVKGSSSKPYCKYGSYSSKLDETNDLLNDDDTSSATNQATSFFNNFNDNDHGLASIITLPLNSIRLMLSDTCVAPHTVYKGVTITLPCGDILWSRQGANNLKDFLNVVYGGFICYYILVNFLLWINRFKNPENDKIEVLDL